MYIYCLKINVLYSALPVRKLLIYWWTTDWWIATVIDINYIHVYAYVGDYNNHLECIVHVAIDGSDKIMLILTVCTCVHVYVVKYQMCVCNVHRNVYM